MRPPQHKRHAPDLARQQCGQWHGRTGRRLPCDLDARRNARARGLGSFGNEAMMPVIAIRQLGYAQGQAGDLVLMQVRQ